MKTISTDELLALLGAAIAQYGDQRTDGTFRLRLRIAKKVQAEYAFLDPEDPRELVIVPGDRGEIEICFERRTP